MKASSKRLVLSWLWVVGGVFLAVLCPATAWAQAKTSPPAVAAPDDRSPVAVRQADPEQLHALQTDRDYQYGREAPPPDNPLARFWFWLVRKIGQFLSSKAYQNVGQYVMLAAIAGAVIYLLMKAEVLGVLFPGRARTSQLTYENLTENIHAIDFDLAIEEAVGQRSYRLAVRLLYLQTLKRLTDAEQIRYKPDKTNRQYVYELANSPLQADFEGLTRQFEFVWYGDLPVDEDQFRSVRQDFQAFNRPFVSQQKPLNRPGNPVEAPF